MKNNNKPYAFISYSHLDSEFVNNLTQNLIQAGYGVAIDRAMSAGEDWAVRAKRLIRDEQCKCVIFIISEKSLISEAVLEELRYTIRYLKPYFALITSGNSVIEKIWSIIKNENIIEEVKDIADNFQDFFPNNKLFIKNDSEMYQKLYKAFDQYGLSLNTQQVIDNENQSENSSELYVLHQVTKEDIEKAILLDYIVYDLNPDERFSVEKCMRWYNINDKIYIMIKEKKTENIIAYINASPITNKTYEDMLNGRYNDIEIDDESIVSYDMPGLYNLYIASIVIRPDYQNKGILKIIYEAFINRMIDLYSSDIIIERIVADAITSKGKKFCEIIGMNKIIHETARKSSIFELKMLPPKIKVISVLTKKLFKLYFQKAFDLGLTE
jgi:hypothetical protein